MKKTLMLASLILALYGASAQIVKEHAFDDDAAINIQLVQLENAGQKFCVVHILDSITYEVVFYNLDFSVFKTVPIDLDPLFIISDYYMPNLSIRYISQNVFDQNGDIDLLCQFYYADSNNDLYAQVLVINETGTVQFETDVENSNAWLLNTNIANGSILPSLTNTGEGAKLILDVYYFNDGVFSFDVYGLPGSLPTGLKNTEALPGGYVRAYPVPADDYIELEYQLDGDSGEIGIYDEQGRTMQTIQLDQNKGVIRVPVSGYNNGQYYYKVNTRRGIPRTGKVIILR